MKVNALPCQRGHKVGFDFGLKSAHPSSVTRVTGDSELLGMEITGSPFYLSGVFCLVCMNDGRYARMSFRFSRNVFSEPVRPDMFPSHVFKAAAINALRAPFGVWLFFRFGHMMLL